MIDGIEIGKVYDYFDDGKITPNRRCAVIIKDIIPFDKIDKETYDLWLAEVDFCDWLFNPVTDYFIVGEFYLEEEKEKVFFVRTLKNKWFSFGEWGGYLDHDGEFLKIMNNYYETYIKGGINDN